MTEKKIKPSDLDREAQRLIDDGMPSLEALLTVVAEMREKYRDQILSARHPKRGKRRAGLSILR
jgi:hypothetical protein